MPSKDAPDQTGSAGLQRRIDELEQQLASAREEREDLLLELAHQRTLAEASFEGIAFFDDSMRCLLANSTAAQLLGYDSPEQMQRMHGLDFVAPSCRPDVSQRFRNKIREAYELVALRRDGSTFPAEVRGRPGQYQGRDVRISVLRDISRRKEIEDELQSALSELEIIFAGSKVGLMLLRGGRYLAKANQTLADILGHDSPEEMTGMSMRELHLSEERYHEFGARYYEALSSTAQLHIEYRLRRKDGSAVWCMLSGQALDRNVPANLDKGVLWVIDDITRIKVQEEQLRTLACTDHLTGVHNRRHFLELAGRELIRRKRHGGECALLLIDLDRFKAINDSLGHDAGDAVLKTFARRCCGALREVDIFGRLGGEEFAVLLPDTDLEGGCIVAERIRARMAEMDTRTPAGNVAATVSVGVSSTQRPAADAEELISRADKALYRAKSEGRDRVVAE